MATSQKLAGKHAIVTGSSKGIGAAIAKALAAEGASVIVNYATSKEGADQVVAAITAAGGKALALQGDVSKQEDIAKLIDASVAAFGPIDILVNNAGLYRGGALGTIDEASFRLHYDLNVLGLILTTQEALKHFKDGGSIINISSVLSTLSAPGLAVYNSTKSAVDGLTRTFSKELGARKIRVNSINPGLTETEGLHSTGSMAMAESVIAVTPLGRLGQPEDIALPVVFLASEDARWITGECLYVTGGAR